MSLQTTVPDSRRNHLMVQTAFVTPTTPASLTGWMAECSHSGGGKQQRFSRRAFLTTL